MLSYHLQGKRKKGWTRGLFDKLPELEGIDVKWADVCEEWDYSPLTGVYTVKMKDSDKFDYLLPLINRLKDKLCKWLLYIPYLGF